LEKGKQRGENMTHNGKEVRIEYFDFPEGCETIRGFLSGSCNFDYWWIAINSRMHPLTQRHSVGHELAHLFLDHLDQQRPIMELEAEANKWAWHYYREYKAGRLETEGG